MKTLTTDFTSNWAKALLGLLLFNQSIRSGHIVSILPVIAIEYKESLEYSLFYNNVTQARETHRNINTIGAYTSVEFSKHLHMKNH